MRGQRHRGHHPGGMRYRVPGSAGGHADKVEGTRRGTLCQVAGGFEERASRGHPVPAPPQTTEALPTSACRIRACDSSKCRSRWWRSDQPIWTVSVGIRHEPVPAQMRRLRARVSRAVDHRELPCRPGSRAVPRLRRAGIVTGGRLPGRRPRTGQAAAHSANTSRKGAGARPVLCYSCWVNITELVIFHRSGGSSPPSDTTHCPILLYAGNRAQRASILVPNEHPP
jgi:hypothetical protein